MFNVGDKIVYPSQGVGVIDLIESKEFKGKMQNYYKIHLFNSSMKLMVPFSVVEPSHIRLVSDKDEIDNIFNHIDEFLNIDYDSIPNNFRERIALNNEKIKSGTLTDCIQVICNLSKINSKHHLNNVEKQMLTSTKKILIEEICQSKNLSNTEAEELLNASITF